MERFAVDRRTGRTTTTMARSSTCSRRGNEADCGWNLSGSTSSRRRLRPELASYERLNQPARQAPRVDAARLESPLEIGDDGHQIGGGLDDLESCACAKHVLHLGKIILVVRAEVSRAACRQ